MVFMCGAKVGFFQGDVKLLVDDMQALKPTLFASVPRLLNRIYDKVCVHWSSINVCLVCVRVRGSIVRCAYLC